MKRARRRMVATARSTDQVPFSMAPVGSRREYLFASVLEAVLLVVVISGMTYFTVDYLKKETPSLFAPSAHALVRFPGVLEAESLPIVSQSRRFAIDIQNMEMFSGGTWSNNAQYYGHGGNLDDWVDLGLPKMRGRFRLIVYFTKSFDYAILKILVNGKVVAPRLDFYSDQVVTSGPIDLGEVNLKITDNRLRLQIVGVNPKVQPPKYFFGIDAIKLTPVK